MRLITDQYQPSPRAKRRFPRSHTFLVTATFAEPMRVADAQRVVREKLAVHRQLFGYGFKITKVRRRRTRR